LAVGEAYASVSGSHTDVYATAQVGYVVGVSQNADAYNYYSYLGGEGSASASLTNEGTISATAIAEAYANAASTYDGFASATAYASGVYQRAYANNGSAAASLTNSGLIEGIAFASAVGKTSAVATASAYGVYQSINGASEQTTFNNSGEISALAEAYAVAGTYEEAYAEAGGVYIRANELGSDSSVVNTGDIFATAIASATDTAEANAYGLVLRSNGANNASITNSGLITAYAQASGNTYSGFVTAEATAVVIGGSGGGGDLTALTNSGGAIWAGESTDGGTTVYRGTAIVTEGGNPVEINLTGNNPDGRGNELGSVYLSDLIRDSVAVDGRYGYVYGDIDIGSEDVINVYDGYTIFDGVINSDGYRDGDLNVWGPYEEEGAGTLVLVQNDIDGPSQVYVDRFYQEAGGTIVYELTPDDSYDAYSHIDANEATVEGNVGLVFQAGLYGDYLNYEDVVVAGTLNAVPVTGFAEIVDNSVLLDTVSVLDGNTIDIEVERNAFDEISGLTRNQNAAAGAIENVYDNIDPDSDFAALVGSLFTLDEEDYPEFLDQLTGAQYAQHLQSVLWSTRAINRVITERMECSGSTMGATQTSGAKIGDTTVMPTADAPMASTGCFEPGQASVWMRGFGSWNDLDGDNEAPGYDETQYGILFGADYSFDENWFLGMAGGYFDSQGDFDNWGGVSGGSIDYDGLQLAAYGGYDDSVIYARGVLAYGNYDGDSHRQIAYPGGSAIDPSGDPSSDVLSFYGETGYRFIHDGFSLTPFIGLSLATADLDGFTESDPEGSGAALRVHDADATSVASVLGVRFGADLFAVDVGSGAFVPELALAWSHEFNDTNQSVRMSFDGAPSGADFTVVGSDVSRDSFLVDAGFKYVIDGSFDFGVYYNGWFNGDYTSNAVTARFGYKF
jgi:outer membrane autotransporter protein